MKKLAIFQFKSITHRLIFGCVAAAIVIYGVSYWNIRQLTKKTAGTWIVDLTQSRIENATHNVETKLLGIERNVLLLIPTILQTDQNSDTAPKDQLLPRLKFLLEQQTEIQAIALIDMPNSPTAALPTGWNYDRQGKYSNLNVNEAREWLTQCDRDISSNQTSHQSFWSQPHSLNTSLSNGLSKSSITYCVPLATNSNIANISPNSPKIRYLAVEIDLDWLSPLIIEQFGNTDEINYRELSDPFVITGSGKQWLLKPNNSQQVQLWLFQTDPRSIALERGFSQTQVHSQDTLIAKTVPSSAWIVGTIFPADKLEQFQRKYLWVLIFSMSKDMVLMCVVVACISQLTTKPLRALNVSTEEMAKGNLDTTLLEATSNDEVGRLTNSFRRMRDSLVLHIQDLQETTAAKQKLESELSIAAQIQRTMLPRISVVRNPNSLYDISAVLRPARIVGGDLYDFFALGSDRLCLVIGDVADKGFPSALQMARTITLIRTLTKSSSTPSEILSTVNRELCAENEDCLFVTVFCGVLELNSGKFTYASGGHDAPILVRDRHVQFLDLETMPPLGLYEDSIFVQHEFTLLPNDLIVFYTDGITEAMNADGEIFSESRLMEMMTSYPPTNTARAVRTIQHFCQEFVADAPQSDDLTLLAVQYLPSNPFSQVPNVMEWKLTLNSVLTELEAVKQTLGKILQEANLTVELIEDAQLIAEEVLVNIIQYGYENRSDGYIDLRIEINDQNLTMTFEDSAKPFNPLTDVATPNLDQDDDARSQGGFGLFLVQELSERVNYVYRNGKNVLTVRQKIVKTA